jgi:hypothetical protein
MNLPPLPPAKEWPARIQKLKRDPREYPIPWFVQWVDGHADFRLMDPVKWLRAVQESRCWVCGEYLGGLKSFVIGPMCGITRTTSEPPCHTECATWSAIWCPFLSNPEFTRRESQITRENQGNIAGCPILRNPGVAVVWTTKTFKIFKDPQGKPLIEVGEPEGIDCYTRGRRATYEELMASVDSGYPTLFKMAEQEGPHAIEALLTMRHKFAREAQLSSNALYATKSRPGESFSGAAQTDQD